MNPNTLLPPHLDPSPPPSKLPSNLEICSIHTKRVILPQFTEVGLTRNMADLKTNMATPRMKIFLEMYPAKQVEGVKGTGTAKFSRGGYPWTITNGRLSNGVAYLVISIVTASRWESQLAELLPCPALNHRHLKQPECVGETGKRTSRSGSSVLTSFIGFQIDTVHFYQYTSYNSGWEICRCHFLLWIYVWLLQRCEEIRGKTVMGSNESLLILITSVQGICSACSRPNAPATTHPVVIYIMFLA